MGDDPVLVRCAPTVVWTRSGDRIYLVDAARATAQTLDGTAAMIWELLALGYNYGRLVAQLTDLLAISAREAREIVRNTLDAWRNENWIERAL